ncbi:MAG: LptF/LptG family permease [Oligoflexales bacterium]
MIALRYLIAETVPSILSTLFLCCSLIVVSQLVRLSEVLVAFGLSAENILLPFLFILMPFMSVIIPIAALFGIMVAISRLSSDGEATALAAAGYGVGALSRPVIATGLVLSLIAGVCGTNLEAWGRREFIQFIYRKTQTELDNLIRFRIQSGVFVKDFLGYVIYTGKVSDDRTIFHDVLLAPGPHSQEHFVLTAPEAHISGSVAEGSLRMTFYDGMGYTQKHKSNITNVLNFQQGEIDILQVYHQQILGDDHAKDDYRSYTLSELGQYIGTSRNPQIPEKTYWKASYLYFSRFANAMTAMSFCLLGLILGLGHERHARNRSYFGAILSVLSSFLLIMLFRSMAEKGTVGALYAAVCPQLIIFSLACFALFQKCRLPASEPIFSWKNFPLAPSSEARGYRKHP